MPSSEKRLVDLVSGKLLPDLVSDYELGGAVEPPKAIDGRSTTLSRSSSGRSIASMSNRTAVAAISGAGGTSVVKLG